MSEQIAKEKAEAYVREQLPELMELNAGCKIINKVTDGVRILTNSPGDEIFVREHYTIIGHPIQLQHWLRVLGMNERYVEMNSWGDVEVRVLLGDKEPKWFLKVNLTTGQPATEEDYQTFCEIVGV